MLDRSPGVSVGAMTQQWNFLFDVTNWLQQFSIRHALYTMTLMGSNMQVIRNAGYSKPVLFIPSDNFLHFKCTYVSLFEKC